MYTMRGSKGEIRGGTDPPAPGKLKLPIPPLPANSNYRRTPPPPLKKFLDPRMYIIHVPNQVYIGAGVSFFIDTQFSQRQRDQY